MEDRDNVEVNYETTMTPRSKMASLGLLGSNRNDRVGGIRPKNPHVSEIEQEINTVSLNLVEIAALLSVLEEKLIPVSSPNIEKEMIQEDRTKHPSRHSKIEVNLQEHNLTLNNQIQRLNRIIGNIQL